MCVRTYMLLIPSWLQLAAPPPSPKTTFSKGAVQANTNRLLIFELHGKE